MKKIIPLTAALACASLIAIPTATAQAKGGGVEVRKSGDCTARSVWDLKAKKRDGRIEIEFEVDSNRVGQLWAFRMWHDGTAFTSGTRRTVAPSGSFTVARVVGDRAGRDTITAKGRNPATGEVCLASLAI